MDFCRRIKDGYEFDFFGRKIKIHNRSSNYLVRRSEKFEKTFQTFESMKRLHQTVFPKYKNKHNNDEIVILATGPTLSKYSPISSAVHIGVNSAIKFDRVILDYFFIQDIMAYEKCRDSIVDSEIKKFFGITGVKNIISDQYLSNLKHERYYVDSAMFFSDFPYDLSASFLADYSSVIFSALQFALWTSPKKVYLVGCDCTEMGYFDKSNKNSESNLKNWMLGWQQFQKFAGHCYPKTEICSIRPVGIKGLFEEVEN